MTKEELIGRYNAIDATKKELRKRESELIRAQGKLLSDYAEEHRPYDDGTILRLKCRVGKAIRYKIGMVSGTYLTKDYDVRCSFKEMTPYDAKCLPKGSKTHYHIASRTGLNVDEILEETVCDKADYPTCSCDTCAWLEAYHNTIGDDVPKLHCSILIDKEVYETNRRACKRYSWWTWSTTENGISHREQLMRDKGEMCEGEKRAHGIFSKVLSEL